MKKARRSGFSIVTAIVLMLCVIGFMPQDVTAAVEGSFIVDGLEYKITSEEKKTVELIGYDSAKPTAIDVEKVRYSNADYTVTSVGSEAFKNCDALATVTLPAATDIGSEAFYDCSNLVTATLPAATTIRRSAFDSCGALATINLPAATDIGSWAFYNCGALATVNLPVATNIGSYAFNNCGALVTVTLPAATTIEERAFASCGKLATVNLPTATRIEGWAFAGCGKLATVNLPAATTIEKRAFYGCDNLATVNLPVATDIGSYAFSNCGALVTATLPAATDIGSSAFEGCGALATVNLLAATTIEERAFANCGKLATVNLPAATTIGEYAFLSCNTLKNISLSNEMKSIDKNAFWNCSTLKKVFVTGVTSQATSIKDIIIGAITHANPTYYKGTRTLPDKKYIVQQNGTVDLPTAFEISGDIWKGTDAAASGSALQTDLPYVLGKAGTGTSINDDNELKIGASENGYITVYALGTTEPLYVYTTPTSLSVTTPPTKTSYVEGETFDKTGMKITADYGTHESRDVTADCTISPSGALKASDKTVTISYNEKTVTQNISVTATTIEPSNPTTATTPTTPKTEKLTTPKAKISSITYKSAKISWNKVSKAKGYQVYRATSKKGKFKKVKTTSTKSWTNQKLSTGKAYYYKVRAYKKVGGKTVYSSFSKRVKAVPKTKAPRFKLTPGNNRIKVKWNKVAGANRYRIYRARTKNGKYKMIKDSHSPLRTYTSIRLTDKHTYYYKMRSYKVVKGKKIYSKYSSVKKVKTK